jgi:DNA polymerase III subunit epsilon
VFGWRFLRRRSSISAEQLLTMGFVALDLETTGLDTRRDAIVSLAAVPFVDGRSQPGYVTLVNPRRPIPAASTDIHGITDSMVADAPPVEDVIPRLVAACGSRTIVGHGIDFDLSVLARDARAQGLARLTAPALDTQRLAAGLHPAWSDLDLEQIAARLGVTVVGRHTAEGDALMAGRIFLALLPELAQRGFRSVSEMLWLQRRGRRPH